MRMEGAITTIASSDRLLTSGVHTPILLHLLEEIAYSKDKEAQVARATFVRALALLRVQNTNPRLEPGTVTIPKGDQPNEPDNSVGGLTGADLEKWILLPDVEDTSRLHKALEAKLDDITHSITRYWCPDEAMTPPTPIALAEDIRNYRHRLTQSEQEARDQQARVAKVMESFNEHISQLQERLLSALDSLPGPISTQRKAFFEQLAATVEAAHLKLALLHARTQKSLYGHRHSVKRSLTMSGALSQMETNLKTRQNELLREEKAVDERICEYEELLTVLDGTAGKGGFRLIVDDWRRVKKETDECRTDLRRLGWRGD